MTVQTPVKPLSPADILKEKREFFNETVLEVVNDFLRKKITSSGTAFILQCEVVTALVERGLDSKLIFAENLLDFEPAFEAVSWRVVYDRPGYNEDYEPSWTFTPKPSQS